MRKINTKLISKKSKEILSTRVVGLSFLRKISSFTFYRLFNGTKKRKYSVVGKPPRSNSRTFFFEQKYPVLLCTSYNRKKKREYVAIGQLERCAAIFVPDGHGVGPRLHEESDEGHLGSGPASTKRVKGRHS